MSESANAGMALYAKVGCMERETFTSTKLQLHLYTDAQCSQLYNDGLTGSQHARKGFKVGDIMVSAKVSFRPPFYSCLSCQPSEVSDTFNKKNSNWYDDDYIAENAKEKNNNDKEDDNQNDAYDDGYFEANDDVYRDDDAKYNYNYNGDDNQNNYGDDNYGGRYLAASEEDLRVRATYDSFFPPCRTIPLTRFAQLFCRLTTMNSGPISTA